MINKICVQEVRIKDNYYSKRQGDGVSMLGITLLAVLAAKKRITAGKEK
jgi:hypothetical protein